LFVAFVVNNIFTVCPGLTFVAVKWVEPDRVNVKKFPRFRSIDAVFEEIVNTETFPCIEPVKI